jgi:tetratricopeptide (TPR) repeat protein
LIARSRATVALLPALLAAAACSSPGSDEAGRAWYAGDPARARLILDEQLADEPDGKALFLNELGVLDLQQRDLPTALQRFLQAWTLMESLTASGLDTTGAIVGSEGSKQWRGDPYERAMNSYYLGIVNYLLGTHDNALAGFKNAIFVDSSKGDDAFDCDFAPALFLEGLAYRQMGESEMAAHSFAAARALAPECDALRDENGGNLVVVVDTGRGPVKVNAGKHGEQTRFIADPNPAPELDIVADGALLGRSKVAGDVWFQASTRGGRTFDAILEAKSNLKTGTAVAGTTALLLADEAKSSREGTVALVGVALLLVSAFTRAEADTRHWTTLPDKVQLFRAKLPPGVHQIEVRPPQGWRVAGPAIQQITVPPQGDVLVYQRVLR